MFRVLSNQHYQHRTNQKLRSWANAVFQNRGVCGQAVPLFPSPSPVIHFFLLSFQLSRRTSRGNACYAGYDWASLIVESKFTIFALFYFVFEGNSPSTSPRGGGAYVRRGDLTEGFCITGLCSAYIWRGLYMERLIFGILRYLKKKATFDHPLQNSEEFAKNQALINLSRQVL